MFRFTTQKKKGSDVNLASHLLRDAFLGIYDIAGVISADTDLVEPIRIVTQEVKKPVVLITPDLHRATGKTLTSAATFVRRVTLADLAASQFSEQIIVAGKSPITRPALWV